MSRSLAAQLEIALVRANKAEAENRDLKEILASKAARQIPTTDGYRQKAIAYCKAHNVRSCSREELDRWNP
jgi:hypothetical protein